MLLVYKLYTSVQSSIPNYRLVGGAVEVLASGPLCPDLSQVIRDWHCSLTVIGQRRLDKL